MGRFSWWYHWTVCCLLLAAGCQFAFSSPLQHVPVLPVEKKRTASSKLSVNTRGFKQQKIAKDIAEKLELPQVAAEQSTWQSQSRDAEHTIRPGSLVNGGTMQKRAMYHFSLDNRLRLVWPATLGVIVPVNIAAYQLEQFYGAILHQVNTVWSLTQPARTILLCYGGFKLSMISNNEAIPWALVSELVEDLLGHARQFWTPTYSFFLQTEDQSTSVTILLEILPTRSPLG
ncbi:MAG: hypothetical protein Q9218_003174 [Villophora microphyllina]